ncbi:hypothetical protein BLNAU_18912 [Blattamonas nauphoetae]|uniref:Uncharacterized protein n=1 Tax=Blattamonas nauphoetae TaxID=2049346 RepID=A0ABQ9X3L5_9EUKA|nr:hypothetical protein BLNAU_18912 [Blattamonas nauphoetae]
MVFQVCNSIGFVPRKGTLILCIPSTEQREKQIPLAAAKGSGNRVVLEVDMDARPRTAVFIINGNVPLTFVSGLPPSIKIGLSMKNEGVSVRFDGMHRLKQATPLRRVNEIKWNLDDLRDSEDMYMNGLRANVLTVETQMPSLVFTDPSHFRVEDNIITSTKPISEGIVAISFTSLSMDNSWPCPTHFGLIDGTTPIPETGQRLGEVENSIAFSSEGDTYSFSFENQNKSILVPSLESCIPVIVEINMDSNPHTAQFFASGASRHVVVIGLPESVRFGFSANGLGMQVRFDRITHLNRGSPFTDQMKVVEWPTSDSLQAKVVDEESVGNENNDQPSKYNPNEAEAKRIDDGEDVKDSNEDDEHSSELMVEKEKDEEESDGATEDDTDEEKSLSENDDVDEDHGTDVDEKKRQLPTMKLPELLFTDNSHFIIRNNIITRTEKGTDKKGRTRPSTVLFSEPITKGVVSVTFVVLTLSRSIDKKGFINLGLLDSSLPVPHLGRVLGENVKHSIGFTAILGKLHVYSRSKLEKDFRYSWMYNKTRIVMEVNMDSTPRTVQFFINGKAGKCYVSGIPESVRIGFSADVMGTSLQNTNIIHSTQPTPITDKRKEIKWTDTNESLEERKTFRYKPIRREAEGSMPALLSRNPEHFKIEGNVITRTTFDYDGRNSP